MRVSRQALCGLIAVSLLVAAAGSTLAGERKRKTAETPSKLAMKRDALKAATPAAPSGPIVPVDGAPQAAPTVPVKTHRNALGQTVYEIAASQADLSKPLAEMAEGKTPGDGHGEGDVKPSRNPQLPLFRRVLANVPDPVAKPAVQVAMFSGGGPEALAPAIGFNFLGVPSNGLSPSDANGSVGNNQFVETVNTRYQVWSLQRSPAKVATSILGPININVLWTGFTGPCEAQNSGDPIVLYDKVAARWMISQFTTGPVSGSYFQCVAVSTSPNATGTYYRYAFAVPGGLFGDYPHFGAWTDAYYVMAHGFTNTSGGYVAALFAAMDRTKMLAGNPTATWQVIQDPLEGGHMPADLDGFALPPTDAPGIFLSLHNEGMYVYRMSVDFATPANTQRTLQAVVPVAPSTGACGGGGACIPQPGTAVTVGTLADRLMFRAAYRNFVDHESIVISHSVDPSVTGVVAGVRWYDIRLSGSPDATCPYYPCLYQQGTIADVANGRSRWMPSIAMDAAENIVVGYSTTGKTNGIENHSIRYSSRAKSDPPGTMPGPEVTVVTGTANNSNSRWGDYTSMSADPFDDCTLWYVNQYFTTTGSWSTRISSSKFETGVGQCPASQCLFRPEHAPTIGAASAPADNQLTVNWTPPVPPPAPGSYAIERAQGACGSEGYYRPVAYVTSPTTTYTDTTVLGGIEYSYRIIAAQDAIGRCQSKVASACVSATATGICNLKPAFAGVAGATSAGGSNCGVTVSWEPATTGCPLTPNLRYNIYRGTTPDFAPAPANRIATCVLGPSSYVDTDNLTSGNTYYYAVRAEDDSTGNGGPCNGGNEDLNTLFVAGTPFGPGTQSSPGTFTDGGGDGNALLLLNVASAGTTGDRPWRFVKTANDPGANHTPGGAYAYRNAGPSAASGYAPDSCSEMQTPPQTIGATTVGLKYWERHQIEYHWDGLVVEYAVNGGSWSTVPAPSNNPADGCDPGDLLGWENFECTGIPPVNACGYLPSALGYNGPLAGGAGCNNWATGPTTAYAHRCHAVTGLTPGDSIQFRWRFTSDPGAEFAGFYLDDVEVTQVLLPTACAPDTCAGQPNGTSCNDGNGCTTGDSCGGGVCQPGTTAPTPGEVADLVVAGASGTTLSWTALGGGIVYDAATSTLSDLRANGTATAACLANDVAGASTLDARPNPAPGDGYYYIVRGQSACASGTYGLDSASVPRSPASACP